MRILSKDTLFPSAVVLLIAGTASLLSCTSFRKAEPPVASVVEKIEIELPGVKEVALAKKYAPIFVNELGSNPKGDIFTNVDFDHDWVGDNNWNNLDHFELKPLVYFEVLSTKTHYFITYGLYHPRDYSYFCAPLFCHENDMEGVLVVVDRKTNTWQYTESVAHNFLRTQTNPNQSDRPTLVVQRGKHGIYPPADYEPSHETKKYEPSDYALSPIGELWNLQFREKRLFEGRFDYQGTRYKILGVPKSFLGRTWTRDTANPPWAWVDLVQGQRGDSFFDPALFISQRHREISVDLTYERNPYVKSHKLMAAGSKD